MGYVAIENSYYRTPEFIKFSKKNISRILEFVIAHVVRGGGRGRKYIYDNYYMKGKLVSRFSQDDMAEYFNTQQSHISTYLSQLEDMKLIRKLERFIGNTRLLYYEVGRWTGELDNKDTYKEKLYFNVFFDALAKAAKELRQMKKGAYSIPELEKLLKKLDPADMWYKEDLEHYNTELARLKNHHIQ